MLGQRQEIARLHSDFYRDEFRKMLRRLILSVIVMFTLIAAIIYFTLVQPSQQYFGNTVEGRILNMPNPVR